MHRRDDREKPKRLANHLAEARGFEPLEEGRGEATWGLPVYSVGRTHPDAQLMKSDCGWMSQSNQL